MSKSLDKQYQPSEIEQEIYQRWEGAGYFAAGDSKNKASYCIMIPPPNVTGSLHMGHAFSDTIMDVLIRYHRMRDEPTLWQAGSDHAGIATQMVVERKLASDDLSRHDLGRDKFIEKIWEWKEESGGNITHQLRRLGASLDWSRERFTMDEGLSNAVTEVFVSLFEEGLIYRGKRLVNWDPVLNTAISDLEVVSTEEDGHLWNLKYPFANDPDQFMVVATTRPETMLGDSAVAVHPDDERYQHLIGQSVSLPLTDREIPVIADEYVDPEFGSGCVKITPAHDFNDNEIGKRHDLPLINIMGLDASIDLQDSKYHGMDRYVARKQIVADLEAAKLLDSISPHKLVVPRGDRTNAVVEPLLTDQWFVKIQPLADPAIEAVKNGDIKFIPENWSNTYFDWMNNIQDWCISRQIWWGHRIPAWYDESGKIYVARTEAEAREQAGPDAELSQDDDVLDTWFSSALWPFSTLGWPEKTEELERFYPTSVLVTGFDIIFFWVARMIMMGLKFTGKAPFKEVYIHGLIRDQDGQKMSKSKGNVLDPLDLIDGIELEALVNKRTTGLMQPEMAPKIEKSTRKQFPDGLPAFGTDALRFTFASQATLGRDIRFDLGRVEGYRNFCNKLWNAARFVLMNTQGQDCGQHDEPYELRAADQWLIDRLQQVEADTAQHIESYRFDQLAKVLYSFVWDEYCSWYLEMAKVLLSSEDATQEQLRGTRRTLVRVLETLLRLLHPVMPFITERIWQDVKALAGVEEKIETNNDTIMLQAYPVCDDSKRFPNSHKEIEWIKSVISAVRNIRGEMNIEPAKKFPVLLSGVSDEQGKFVDANQALLERLGNMESVEIIAKDSDTPESATALVGEVQVLVPLGSLIDKQAELSRLGKESERLAGGIKRAESKLSNPGFVDKAPEAVVAKERSKLEDAKSQLELLSQQISKIEALD